MTHNLNDRLPASLGDRFTIERELAGGGMSRVFVAEETRLHRRVVVKVLPPDLIAELSTERFRREIAVTAGLQQANIVPVLDAGDDDGLPWYSMPYIAGESLRARLDRGELPINDAIGILRDVAKALAFAHANGVVHRDIKPGNVLLSGGTAVVADFGIAKAIDAARTRDQTLTHAGSSVGTPAYMSPEQAVGSEVDARSDIYAWGMMAYEALAGRHPFAESASPQQMIASQITVTPPALSRAGVPPALASIVMRSIDKDPEKRPASANDLVQACEASASASVPRTQRWRRPALVAGCALAIAAAIVAAVAMRNRSTIGAAEALQSVVVLRFENRTGDASFDRAGLVIADWVARGITQSGSAVLMSMPAEISPLADSLYRVHRTAPDRARALERATGATRIIGGEIDRRGDSLIVSAHTIDAADGRVVRNFGPVATTMSDPVPAADSLRDRITGAFASERETSLPKGSTQLAPSYPAYLEYVEGDRAYSRGQNPEAFKRFRNAVLLDTTFSYALIRAAYATYYTSQFSAAPCATVDSIAGVLSVRRRLVTAFEEQYFRRLQAWCRGDWNDAFLAAQTLMQLAPHDPDVTYLTGRSALYLQQPRTALSYFAKIDARYRSGEQRYRDVAAAHHQLGDDKAALAYLDAADESSRASEVVGVARMRILAGLHRGASVDSLIAAHLARPRRLTEMFIVGIGELRRHGEPAWADTVARRFVSWQPSSNDPVFVRAVHAMALLLANRAAEARPVLDSLVNEGFVPTRTLAAAGVAAALMGDRDGAIGRARQLESFTTGRLHGEASYGRAQIAAALGDRAEAVRLLQASLGEGIPYYFGTHFISTIHVDDSDPLLSSLNGYEPFERLIAPKG